MNDADSQSTFTHQTQMHTTSYDMVVSHMTSTEYCYPLNLEAVNLVNLLVQAIEEDNGRSRTEGLWPVGKPEAQRQAKELPDSCSMRAPIRKYRGTTIYRREDDALSNENQLQPIMPRTAFSSQEPLDPDDLIKELLSRVDATRCRETLRDFHCVVLAYQLPKV